MLELLQAALAPHPLTEQEPPLQPLPIPPEVAMQMMVMLEHLAWYSSLMRSCNMMVMEGIPISCWNQERDANS
jgi:hypothetical protein